ncbi:hypothetical protein QQG55_56700 [Brugia pahangi]
MLPFLLTFLLDILFINDIHAQEWQCYDVLKQCISGNSNLLDINMINSSNINHFCETYTQLIIPCLAKRMNEKPGVTYRERYLFRKCIENDLSRQNDSGIMMNTVKILRLYLYSCIYNSMADMSQSNCFIKLVQNCVEKIPTTRKCYYWPCKSQDFLTLKRSNLILPKEDEEDKDDEDYNEAKNSYDGDHKTGKWKSSRVQITNNSVTPNGNSQIMKQKFAVYFIAFVSITKYFILN